MTLTAGMDSVEARPTPDSALQRKGDNTTSVIPFNQQEFNNLSHPTAMEFNPYTYKVTPELLDHLGKFVKDPKKFIQDTQKQYDPQSIQKREQRQEQRQQLAKKAQEALKSVRKLFEEIPGKESSETNRMKLDEGAERLTPDKIDPEVWRNVRKMLTEKMPISDQQSNTRRDLNDNTGTPIVLVHGITGSGWDLGPWGYNSDAGSNCNDNYWGEAIKYLTDRGYSKSNIHTVKFYTGDTNCDVDLHNKAYQDKCNSFSPGSEGTNNEDLNHVSCLLAQYLNQNFAGGKKVILVGHSMGGNIIRNTMHLAETQGGYQGMPKDIGHVTDAATFNSPHAGVNDDGYTACGGCTQIMQLTGDDPFMKELTKNAQNPQTSAGFTQWTVVGSECDPYVGSSLNPDGAATAIAMDASHAIMYTHGGSPDACYDHSSALGDSSTKNDATLYYCDTNNPTGNPCGTNYQNNAKWKKTTTGSRGLQTLYGSVGR